MLFRHFCTTRNSEKFFDTYLTTVGAKANRLVASVTADLLVLNHIVYFIKIILQHISCRKQIDIFIFFKQRYDFHYSISKYKTESSPEGIPELTNAPESQKKSISP